ncbi:MAG: fused MFS/spermidine synthase [bacterium]|nr:fused MFS/spermidine synthase [bacterium]
MERLKNFIIHKKLLLVVFVTGAAVLVIEVSATRILATYFGNTLYSFSSILSIVLGALSLGYYYGGRMADKNPSRRNFYLIILYSGVSVLLLYVLSLLILPILGFLLSPMFGPLIASLLLFFIPSLLLGMLSPFAIKLQSEHAPSGTIGTISGEVFFWSTLGSIGGSLISGFFLIPSFGVDVIMVGLALTLVIVGVLGVGVGLPAPHMSRQAGLPVRHRTQTGGISKNTAQNIGFLVISALVVSFMWWQGLQKIFLFVGDGIYEKLYVYDGVYEGKPTRFFTQDTTASGAMNLKDGGLAYEYTKYYDAYRVFNPDIKHTLVIGGGIYSIPKQLLADISDVRVDVAEIEPSLYGLAKKYFGLKDDPRLSNYIVDGRRFLHDSTNVYDFIFTDAYKSLYSMPVHLTTKEFFETANKKLASGGVFMANIIGSLSPETPSFTLSEMRTFRSVFPNSYFFATKSPQSTEPQNLIFIGFKSDKTPNFNSSEVLHDRNPLVRSLDEKLIDLSAFDFSQYTMFTDNYAPVEYYGARFLADVVRSKNK